MCSPRNLFSWLYVQNTSVLLEFDELVIYSVDFDKLTYFNWYLFTSHGSVFTTMLYFQCQFNRAKGGPTNGPESGPKNVATLLNCLPGRCRPSAPVRKSGSIRRGCCPCSPARTVPGQTCQDWGNIPDSYWRLEWTRPIIITCRGRSMDWQIVAVRTFATEALRNEITMVP